MVVWAAENKFKLLLGVISQHGNLAVNYDELAATLGPEYTASAVKQQLNKIKRDAGVSAGGEGSADTPKKGTLRTPRKPKDEGKRKGGDDDDDETQVKSAKKMKVEAKDEGDD